MMQHDDLIHILHSFIHTLERDTYWSSLRRESEKVRAERLLDQLTGEITDALIHKVQTQLAVLRVLRGGKQHNIKDARRIL